MTAIPLMAVPEQPESTRLDRAARRFARAGRAGAVLAARVLGARSRAGIGALREHLYAACGLGAFTAAGFVHSTFTGLLVLGASFLVFEFKTERPED